MHDNGIYPGDRVRAVGRHWLRPHGFGFVSAIEPDRGENMYLIEFDRLGKGIEGKFLYMDRLSFEVIGNEQGTSNSNTRNAA